MKQGGAPASARERIREELTREITDVARSHLAEQGSAALSLRAIAREMGMVSSAIYRYFPSRDELLTTLIIDAYEAVATAAENAETSVPRRDLLGRWLATAHATRRWALAHPQEYALIFGSPVPGYRAPQDTVNPASRIPILLMQILADANPGANPGAEGESQRQGDDAELPESVFGDLHGLREQLPEAIRPALDEPQLDRGIMAWTHLIGSISFELFGHLHRVIYNYEEYFDFSMRKIARQLGLPK